MKKLNLDPFKLVLLGLLTWLCFSMHGISKNGRYVHCPDNYCFYDTQTGSVYEYLSDTSGHSPKHQRFGIGIDK
ncbi:MAG TPA: hypothetical protein VMV56_09825 [Williamwhitmania sp.]|nr:hypothetical protein [Williamwhitmania sp.]